MGRQHDLYGLVNVAPFRVMVALLGDQRDTGHEAEGLVEILEDEAAADRGPAVHLDPAGKLVERRLAGLRRQKLCHPRLLLYRSRHWNSAILPARSSLPFPAANHDGLVTRRRQEFCYNFQPNHSGSMNLNLKRLFARSMTGGVDPAEPPSPPSPRSARRKATLITLAGVLAIVGVLA